MAALTTITADADGTTSCAYGGGGDADYRDIASVPDGGSADYAYNSGDATETSSFSLEDVDADFGSMATLSIYWDIDVNVNGESFHDGWTLSAQIWDANTGGNALTDSINLVTFEGGSGDPLARTQSNTAFTGLTGTKAQWNSAYVRFTWTYAKYKGGYNTDIQLFGFNLQGTYNVAATRRIFYC